MEVSPFPSTSQNPSPAYRTPLPLVGEGRVRVSMWHVLASIENMTGLDPHPTLSRKRERGSVSGRGVQ